MSTGQVIFLISASKSLEKKLAALLKQGFPDAMLKTYTSGTAGLAQIYESPPSCVVVDSTISDISGLQLCRVLKQDPTVRQIPIILLSKDNQDDYRRHSEFVPIADAFIEHKQLSEEFIDTLIMLKSTFKGLLGDAQEHLELLQQETVKVQALNRMVQLFDQSITENSVLSGFTRLFEMVHNSNLLLHMLFSQLEHLIDYDAAGVFFNDDNREPRNITYHVRDHCVTKASDHENWTQHIFKELETVASVSWSGRAITHNLINDELPKGKRRANLEQVTVYPFYLESKLVGTLALLNQHKINYALIFPFDALLQQMSVLMRIRHYYSQAETLTITDAFTGLYTYQHFSWSLEREMRRAKRLEAPLSLALISLDNFRELNTQWGHALADNALKKVAQDALQSIRETDLLARASGNKILALFTNTSEETAKKVLKRIEKTVRSNSLEAPHDKIEIELRSSLIEINPNIGTPFDFVKEVEKALDKARLKG